MCIPPTPDKTQKIINPDIITNDYILAVVVGGLVRKVLNFSYVRKTHLIDLFNAS